MFQGQPSSHGLKNIFFRTGPSRRRSNSQWRLKGFLCWKTGTTLAPIMIQRLWLGGENSIRHGRNLKSNTEIDFIECFVIICFRVPDHFVRAICNFIRLCIRLRECQAVTPQRDSWVIVLIKQISRRLISSWLIAATCQTRLCTCARQIQGRSARLSSAHFSP